MELDGLVYGLALRPDSDELRALGDKLLAVAQGDLALVVGWLLHDWQEIYSRDLVDAPLDSQVDSYHARPANH